MARRTKDERLIPVRGMGPILSGRVGPLLFVPGEGTGRVGEWLSPNREEELRVEREGGRDERDGESCPSRRSDPA
jgi:hypothetical protein